MDKAQSQGEIMAAADQVPFRPRVPSTSRSERTTVIKPDDDARWELLNESPFVFRHNLAHHHLFEISQLTNIAECVVNRGDPHKFAVSTGSPGDATRPMKDQLLDALCHVAEGTAWLKMSSLHELDPAYERLRKDIIDELEDLTKLPLLPCQG